MFEIWELPSFLQQTYVNLKCNKFRFMFEIFKIPSVFTSKRNYVQTNGKISHKITSKLRNLNCINIYLISQFIETIVNNSIN